MDLVRVQIIILVTKNLSCVIISFFFSLFCLLFRAVQRVGASMCEMLNGRYSLQHRMTHSLMIWPRKFTISRCTNCTVEMIGLHDNRTVICATHTHLMLPCVRDLIMIYGRVCVAGTSDKQRVHESFGSLLRRRSLNTPQPRFRTPNS